VLFIELAVIRWTGSIALLYGGAFLARGMGLRQEMEHR
jgi:hypothetical protein